MAFGMERPIRDRHMQKALDEIKHVIARGDYVGFVMLANKTEWAWTYKMITEWNAIYHEPRADLGIRIRAQHNVPGDNEKLQHTAETFANMIDFGRLLQHLGESLMRALTDNGMIVEHTPIALAPIDLRDMRR